MIEGYRELIDRYRGVQRVDRGVKRIVFCTCRLPLGQYSVMMHMFGGSMQAPMKRVRCSF